MLRSAFTSPSPNAAVAPEVEVATDNETVQLMETARSGTYGTTGDSVEEGGVHGQRREERAAEEENGDAAESGEDGEGSEGENNGDNDEDEDEEPLNERDATIERLTRRLRCLFSAITWPIVPLGTLVSFNLLWVLYAAFVLDARRKCSHPLHAYALASLLFLIYAPYHAQVRAYLFRYSRERDGPVRPTRVRLYDQLFHTLCILYVYGGVTLIQTCQGDIPSTSAPTSSPAGSNATMLLHDHAASLSPPPNTCETTCPRLYPALDLYVTALELFTLSLILPLLFLPCIYLWILRRASPDAETLLQESIEEDEIFGTGRRRGTSVSAQELMESLEPVKFIRDHHAGGELVLVSERTGEKYYENDSAKECCICMSEFVVEGDEETGSDMEEDDFIVRTKCGHLFHQKCLAGWIGGGRWDQGRSRRRRARRTCCPLCREDLRPSNNSQSSAADQQSSG